MKTVSSDWAISICQLGDTRRFNLGNDDKGEIYPEELSRKVKKIIRKISLLF